MKTWSECSESKAILLLRTNDKNGDFPLKLQLFSHWVCTYDFHCTAFAIDSSLLVRISPWWCSHLIIFWSKSRLSVKSFEISQLLLVSTCEIDRAKVPPDEHIFFHYHHFWKLKTARLKNFPNIGRTVGITMVLAFGKSDKQNNFENQRLPISFVSKFALQGAGVALPDWLQIITSENLRRLSSVKWNKRLIIDRYSRHL